MTSISTQKMSTAGQILKARRLSIKKSLDEMSSETKIKKEYLSDIENDRYEKFNSQVFLTGFIKIYANNLGLNVENILAVYRRTMKTPVNKEIKLNKPKHINKKKLNEIVSPKIAIISLLLVFLLSIIGYIGYQVYNFQKDPLLDITSPSADLTVKDESIEVEGKTDIENRVTINDKEIEVNSLGEFNSSVELTEGKNLLVFKATRRNNENKSVQIIRTITYEPEVEPEESHEEEPEVNEVVINISNSETWAQIVVDDMQKTGEVLPVGFNQTYTISKSLFINSGIPGNVTLKFNGTDLPIISNPLQCSLDINQQPAQLNCN